MVTNDNYKDIVELDLEAIKFKLMHASAGAGWSKAKAEAIALEYRRFLCLHLSYPDERYCPTEDVDTFWHYHILDTMKYAADCAKVFGYFLHHYPYLGLLDGSGDDEADLAATLTRERYESTFGEAYMRAEAYGHELASSPVEGDHVGVRTAMARCTSFCQSAKPADQGAHSARCTSFCQSAKPVVQGAESARCTSFCQSAKPVDQGAKSERCTSFCQIARPANPAPKAVAPSHDSISAPLRGFTQSAESRGMMQAA